ncbi:MAG: hypothetical protein SFU86_04115 [Pirellulaceae bacterium]|nr:hypothetical protein [Pirellulaceae bacterium]
MKRISLLITLLFACAAGCQTCDDGACDGGWFGGGHAARKAARRGPGYDRPFPIGQVTDSFWEAQETNAEAADFIFFDHEFKGNTAELGPAAKQHLEQVALRLEHVPFPVVIEQSPHNARPELDQARRRTIVEQLARMGAVNVQERIIVADAFPQSYTQQEAEATYYGGIMNGTFSGGVGRRFGGYGGVYR